METLENVADVVAAVVAVVVLGAYVCRVNQLRYIRHRTALVLVHVMMAGVCIFALEAVAYDRGGLLPLLGAVAAALHLLTTFPSWRGGHVPSHYDSGPVPLDPPNEPASSRPPPHPQRS